MYLIYIFTGINPSTFLTFRIQLIHRIKNQMTKMISSWSIAENSRLNFWSRGYIHQSLNQSINQSLLLCRNSNNPKIIRQLNKRIDKLLPQNKIIFILIIPSSETSININNKYRIPSPILTNRSLLRNTQSFAPKKALLRGKLILKSIPSSRIKRPTGKKVPDILRQSFGAFPLQILLTKTLIILRDFEGIVL